MAARNNGGKKH